MDIAAWQQLLERLEKLCPCPVVWRVLFPYRVVWINGRAWRLLKQLGEGGYAFVYLAESVTQDRAGSRERVAIKRVLAGSADRLAAARCEIEVLCALRHPNCLQLLDHAVLPCGGTGGVIGSSGNTSTSGSSSSNSSAAGWEVLLVTPAYEDGTLLDELDRLALAGEHLSTHHVLCIFEQVCAAVAHMHSRGFAHFDVKPHNVLLRRPRPRPTRRHWDTVSRNALAAGAAATVHNDDELTALADAEAGVNRLVGPDDYTAVLVDFGSARRIPLPVKDRTAALALQEEAEAHCTATYRAPELFDVPSPCIMDGGVDVWALGCTLFATMYGASPFQAALDRGGSIALAVINGAVPWPHVLRYPESLRDLVIGCLCPDRAARPSAAQLLERVRALKT